MAKIQKMKHAIIFVLIWENESNSTKFGRIYYEVWIEGVLDEFAGFHWWDAKKQAGRDRFFFFATKWFWKINRLASMLADPLVFFFVS